MKYYGFGYRGVASNYEPKDLPAHDSPYQALLTTSKEWDNGPDSYKRRLLVVLGIPDSENAGGESRQYAFFQFTSAEACMDFIKKRKGIEWLSSSVPMDGCWNGDAHMME